MTGFWVVSILVVLLLAEGYFWPVRKCWLCKGTAEHRSPLSGTRPCSCGGGQVLKWRARLLGKRIEE